VIAALDGWQLAAVIIVGALLVAFIVVLVLMREGRSRKVRVGVFVEREYDALYKAKHDEDEDTQEWPTQS
jgi:nitrate/nitrite transporter NarK